MSTLDHFYEIHVQHTKDDYIVYWRSPLNIPIEDVPAAAVKDGHLGDFDLKSVDYALEITAEEYLEFMNDN
jgi:hypothetical protein